MRKPKKTYKPTKNVLIKDVPKGNVRMFNLVVRLMDGDRTQTEAFNKMVMSLATEYLGEELAQKRLEGYQKLENEIKERSLRYE